MGKLVEGHYKFVVDGSGLIPYGSNELLDAELAGVVEQRAAGSLCGILNL